MNDQRKTTFELLDKLFTSTNRNDWGSKSYLVDRIAREVGTTKAAAGRFHKEWAEQEGTGAKCPECDGSGDNDDGPDGICIKCHGSGTVNEYWGQDPAKVSNKLSGIKS